MCPLKSLSCFAIPQWWLPQREVPLVSPKDSHCDSEEVTASADADSMGFYGDPRRIEEVTANPYDFYEWVMNPTASTDGEWMELVESEQSLTAFSGDSGNPIHYESTKNQIATNLLRENVKSHRKHSEDCRGRQNGASQLNGLQLRCGSNPASASLGCLGGLLLSEEVPERWWGSWVGQLATELLPTVIYSVLTDLSCRKKFNKPMKKTTLSLLFVVGLIGNSVLGFSQTTADAKGIGVLGTHLTKDGRIWIPQGTGLGSFTYAPYFSKENHNKSEENGGFIGAAKRFGPEILTIAKEEWKIDSIRFLVSQPGLDPQSKLYSQAYLEALTNGVNICLSNGLSVIIAMQDEKHSGETQIKPLPTEETIRAWNKIGDLFSNNPYVMYEVFNECGKPAENINKNWDLWLNGGIYKNYRFIGHQQIINIFRSRGWNNVLIVDGIGWARFIGKRALDLKDPSNRLAFGVHPYFTDFCNSPEKWDNAFGNISKVAPVLITEWFENSKAPFGVKSYKIPIWCHEFLGYIKKNEIPLWTFALDIPSTIVQDYKGSPNNWENFNPNGIKLGDGGAGCGRMVRNYFSSTQN